MPRPMRVVLKINQPESLYAICIKYVATKIDQTISYKERGLRYVRPDILLTSDIMNDILEAYYNSSKQLNDSIIHLFASPSPLRITRLNLSNSECTGDSLKWVAHQKLQHLSITHENYMQNPEEDVPALQSIAPTLISLSIADHLDALLRNDSIRSQIYSVSMETGNDAESGIADQEPSMDFQLKDQWLLNAPGLQNLTVHRLEPPDIRKDKLYTSMFYYFLSRFTHLVELNLFGCGSEPHHPFKYQHILVNSLYKVVPHITSLTLSDIFPYNYDIKLYADKLAQLTNLRHLDISRCTPEEDVQNPPSVSRSLPGQIQSLNDLIKQLPRLISLDLSGTHLAEPAISSNSDPIPSLEGREFKFLGLFLCPRKPCRKSNLPAKVITGISNCIQVEEAVRRYKNRETFTESVMLHLYHLLMESGGSKELSNPAECLLNVCWVMRHHTKDASVLTSATAAAFYIIRDNVKTFCTYNEIHQVIDTLCIVIRNSLHENSIMKNILLTFTLFDIPEDVLFRYRELVKLMLKIVRLDGMEFSQSKKYAVSILNSLACRVEDEDKKLAGDIGVIEEMMQVIIGKLEDSTQDSILEKAWSVLWNITDETPENCKRFMDGKGIKYGGLTLFYGCYTAFCDPITGMNESLLRNMLGLLGNIAEVPSLRKTFRDTKYLKIFRDILQHTELIYEDDLLDHRNIEVSYNTAGIVSHLASDGPDVIWGTAFWCDDRRNSILFADEVVVNEDSDSDDSNYQPPTLRSSNTGMIASGGEFNADLESDCDWRQLILDAMVKAIQHWTIRADRLINYRSLNPITKLLLCEHTWEVRYWAIWALCNLTTFAQDKYCKLIHKEDSISSVLAVYNSNDKPNIMELAKEVLTNYERWAAARNKPIAFNISTPHSSTDT